MEEYIQVHQMAYQPEDERQALVHEGVRLLSELRRFHSILRSQLAHLQPSAVAPLSCSAFCHLLDDDPAFLHAPSTTAPDAAGLLGPPMLDRLHASGVIDPCQLKGYVCAWGKTREAVEAIVRSSFLLDCASPVRAVNSCRPI